MDAPPSDRGSNSGGPGSEVGSACDGQESANGGGDDKPRWSWRGFLLFCGPGLLMSVAYLVRPVVVSVGR
jgi:hypothetical protein